MSVAVEILRRKARDYELSSLSAQERDDVETAIAWSAVAVVLFEVAEALEEDE